MAKNSETSMAGHNSHDKALLQKICLKILKSDEELASEKGAHMARCKAIRKKKTDALKEAREGNLNKSSIDAMFATIKQLGALEAVTDSMDQFERADFETYLEDAVSWGGTPFASYLSAGPGSALISGEVGSEVAAEPAEPAEPEDAQGDEK